MMNQRRILWVDDEIEVLRPHLLFLSGKGYDVVGVPSGHDAIARVESEEFDLIFLDEMMPGMDGLATLERIKEVRPNLPVVMVTKSEEESLMEQAIGQKIDDYLVKPVNPSQVLSVAKRILERRKIREDHLSRKYVQDFQRLENLRFTGLEWSDWVEVHRLLSEWDLEIDQYRGVGLAETHREHRKNWNAEFSKFIERHYPAWLKEGGARPPLSVDVVSRYLYPHLRAKEQVFFFVIDCMRLDQWLALEPLVAEDFTVERDYYFSILPTATPFSRNALFAGLYPDEVARLYPEAWAGDSNDASRNRNERQLLDRQLEHLKLSFESEPKYIKVLEITEGENLARKLDTYRNTPLLSVVFNFLDHLVHGRSESDLLQEMAPDEAAFRTLMKSWFLHSSLYDVLKQLARWNCKVVITTDHGAILGGKGTVARGRRDASTHLRYKYGENLGCDPKAAVKIDDPKHYRLPAFTRYTNYIFAREDYYFVYQTNFHEYERQFRGSFQHGGISLEEMVLPVVTLTPRGR
jgi:CheY-like chemotaxis protein